MARLRKMQIDGLFGHLNQPIEFNVAERVTALLGPNGVGKTICLKFIEALYKRKYAFFCSVPFSSVSFEFEGDQTVTVKPTPEKEGESESSRSARLWPLTFSFKEGKGKPQTWKPKKLFSRSQYVIIERELPFLIRETENVWMDRRSYERMSTEDVFTRYSDVFSKHSESDGGNEPEKFKDIVNETDCRFVDTQRLVLFPEVNRPDRPRRENEPRLVVRQKAEILTGEISRLTAEFARLSQILDSTYIKRVFSRQSSGKSISAEDVKDRLTALEKKRKELQQAGIVDAEKFDQLFMPGNVGNSDIPYLQTYVEDNERKLDIYNEMLSKAWLFQEIIKDKFSDKKLFVSRADGFYVVSDRTGEKIPLDKLSSGEQHEIVLSFELLFQTKKNSIILIDEPEISLHIGWQKKFIGDLLRIVEKNPFDVVLATHSPQLIGRWQHLAIDLGEAEE